MPDTPDGSFDQVMAGLRADDPAAAEEVFRRYARRLVGLARARLDPLVRRQTDPEDVMQSVLKSFFARQADGRLDAADWSGLWTLLTVLTVRKCGRTVAYHRAAKRDVRRDAAPADLGDSVPSWEGVAADPTPEEAAALTEQVFRLLDRLGERDQRIVVMALQGYSSSEVGAEVGCTERTVQRVLERVRDRLRCEAGESD